MLIVQHFTYSWLWVPYFYSVVHKCFDQCFQWISSSIPALYITMYKCSLCDHNGLDVAGIPTNIHFLCISKGTPHFSLWLPWNSVVDNLLATKAIHITSFVLLWVCYLTPSLDMEQHVSHHYYSAFVFHVPLGHLFNKCQCRQVCVIPYKSLWHI